MAWKGESRRHSLARKGVKTARRQYDEEGNYIPTHEERRRDIGRLSARGFSQEELDYIERIGDYANQHGVLLFQNDRDGEKVFTVRVQDINAKSVDFQLHEFGHEDEVKSFIRNLPKAESIVQEITGSGMEDIFYDW